MEGESDNLEHKRAAPLSTVSLDSTYDEAEPVPKPAKKRRECSWTFCLLLLALILICVGLLLALDRGGSVKEVVDVDEVDPSFSPAHAGAARLNAPQKKLVGWLKQMRSASELYVEGSNSNMSLNGVVFPRNESETLVPFDALVVVYSGEAMPSRQYVALANGKGYQWTETQLGYGDSIMSDGCLTANRSLPFQELDSIVETASWTPNAFEDERDVTFEFDGANYTVSKEEGDDYGETDDEKCWVIESEENELGMNVCIPSADDQLSNTDFEGILQAPAGCPPLAPNASHFSVPLPLRKWYASYKV